MYRLIAAGVAGAALVALCACSNSNNSTPPLSGDVRVVNDIPDSNGLSSSIDNGTIASSTPFEQSTGLNGVPEGGYTVQLSTGNGSGGTINANANNVGVDHNNITTVYAYGTVASGTIGGFATEESVAAPSSSSNFVVQFADGAYAATASGTGSFNVYAVTPGAGIGGASATNVPFGTASTSFNIAAGTYELIVTDSSNATVFDSGPSGVALPPTNSNVVQIGILDVSSGQDTQYGSAIALIVLDNNGGQSLLLAGQH